MSDAPESEDDIDYLFQRLSADRLARHILGDVRISPSSEQIAQAQKIIDHTGTLYRLRAGFRADGWQKRANASDVDPTAGADPEFNWDGDG